jgi:putative chitinase
LVPTPDLAEVVPTPEVPTPVPDGSTFVYVVRSGDTLFSIARRFGADVEELVRANDLSNADTLQVGQKLVIPGSSPPSEGPETPATVVHVVQRGETLQVIALRYGVTQGAIMAANELANPNRIYVGQRLTIPGGAAPTESGPRTHVVQRGETLSQIAQRYGVTLQAVQNANGITDPDSISVGQRLTIP